MHAYFVLLSQLHQHRRSQISESEGWSGMLNICFKLSDFDHHQWCFEKDFQLPAPLTDNKKFMFHFICQTIMLTLVATGSNSKDCSPPSLPGLNMAQP